MSSTEPRAAEATAWQRAVLDELGAPPAGLARLTPRGTGGGRHAAPPASPPANPPASPAPPAPPAPHTPVFPPPVSPPSMSAAEAETARHPISRPAGPAPAPPAPHTPAPHTPVSPPPVSPPPVSPPPVSPPPVSPPSMSTAEAETARHPIFNPSPNAETTSFDRPRTFGPPSAENPPSAHRIPAAGRGRPAAYEPPKFPYDRPRPTPRTPQPPFGMPRRDLPAAERTNFDPSGGAGPERGRSAGPPVSAPLGSQQSQADPHPESLLRRSRHGDPMLRRFAREVRKVTGASQDSFQDAALAEAIQQPVTTGRRIAVTSIRGGAGKSVVSALMATALAHFRQDRVLAVDADPGIGSLMLRLGMTTAPSLRHLAGGRANAGSFDAVRTYLAQTDAGVWALGGTEDRFGQVNLEDYRTATNLLARFFGVTVTDCGAGLTGDLHEGILADAHAQVMVTPATPDGAISARRALDMLATAHRELATRTIVVFVTHAAGAGIDLNRAIAMMPSWCPRVEHLAFDRHLADGSLIDASRLAEPTRVAALRIAAASLTLAVGRSLPQ